MKNAIIFLIFISFSFFSSADDVYVYPSKVILDLTCELPEENLRKIEYNYSDPEAGHRGMAKAFPVSLSVKEDCEIYLDNPSMYEGNGNSFTTILISKDGDYRPVGDIQWGPDSWWYGEFVNGYPRIFVPTYAGHRTNPINVTDVYYFNGASYTKELDSEYSHGYFSDLGLKAYKKKNYYLAEKWYLNAYRMRNEKSIDDANNLALTYIRQNRCEEAIGLLKRHLKHKNITKKQEDSAKFNMALCNPS